MAHDHILCSNCLDSSSRKIRANNPQQETVWHKPYTCCHCGSRTLQYYTMTVNGAHHPGETIFTAVDPPAVCNAAYTRGTSITHMERDV